MALVVVWPTEAGDNKDKVTGLAQSMALDNIPTTIAATVDVLVATMDVTEASSHSAI
jgi:hypothetical protein